MQRQPLTTGFDGSPVHSAEQVFCRIPDHRSHSDSSRVSCLSEELGACRGGTIGSFLPFVPLERTNAGLPTRRGFLRRKPVCPLHHLQPFTTAQGEHPKMQNSSAFQYLTIDTIQESSTNPARTFEEAKLHELAESIRQHGHPAHHRPSQQRWFRNRGRCETLPCRTAGRPAAGTPGLAQVSHQLLLTTVLVLHRPQLLSLTDVHATVFEFHP